MWILWIDLLITPWAISSDFTYAFFSTTLSRAIKKPKWVGPISEACHHGSSSAKFDSNNRFALIPVSAVQRKVGSLPFRFFLPKSDSISIRSVPLSHFVPWKMILDIRPPSTLLTFESADCTSNPLPLLSSHTQFATRNVKTVYESVCRQIWCTLDVVFRQISTFLEDSVAVVYGLRGF